MKSLRRNRNYKRKSNRRRTKSNRRSTKRRTIKGGYGCSDGLCIDCDYGLSPNSRNRKRKTSLPCYCENCGLEQAHNTYALSDAEKMLDD
jgi:hypothetical protein